VFFVLIPVERLKLMVFDLDGTLIDSAQDLCNSVNATLAHFGRKHLEDTRSRALLAMARRCWCGAHWPRSTARQLRGVSANGLCVLPRLLRAHKLDYTYAYDGVLESLAAVESPA